MWFRKIDQLQFSQIYDALHDRLMRLTGPGVIDSIWQRLGDTPGERLTLIKGTITSAMRLRVSLVRFRATGTTHRLTDYTRKSQHNWRSLLERRVHWSSATITQPDGYHWQITT